MIAVVYLRGAVCLQNLVNLGTNIVASAFTHTIQAEFASLSHLVRDSVQSNAGGFVLPEFLSCLVLSWSEQRSHFLQSVAGDESWQAEVCDDVQEFLRSIFQLDVPLTIVDLPPKGTASYAELREMATQICGLNRSLVVVCGAPGGAVEDDGEEERWARQLGAWAYLPGATDPSGLRLVFAEARKALAKQSSSYLTTGYLSTG